MLAGSCPGASLCPRRFNITNMRASDWLWTAFYAIWRSLYRKG